MRTEVKKKIESEKDEGDFTEDVSEENENEEKKEDPTRKEKVKE